MPEKLIISNEELEKKFRVADSPIHGQGLFARTNIRKGTYLGTYHGPAARKNGMHVLWVQNENGYWRGRDGKNLLRYLNHSSKPNAEFDGHDLYVLKGIKPGQEVTFDYGEDPGE